MLVRNPIGLLLVVVLMTTTSVSARQNRLPKYFISVDMEGIGGVGTSDMTSSGGKDYSTGRDLMTKEVNTVVEAILAAGPATILVNESHGDMQNLLIDDLDPRVELIQGNIKPLGMVQGLDETYDGAFFLGYHSKAGTEDGFLAHTGSGSVKGLWINGTEVGEGGLNAFFAASKGVPVLVAAGDKAFASEFGALVPGAVIVTTKEAVGSMVARMPNPSVVRERLTAATREALGKRNGVRPIAVTEPVTARMRFATTTRGDILQAIPGMRRVDGFTVEFDAETMDAAYRMVRLAYKYISW